MTNNITQIKSFLNSKNTHFIDVKNNYRYERKFTVPKKFSTNSIIHSIKENSFLFREVFYQRQINNIYFDTEQYNDYFDNVLGVSNRKKIRIRWYGNMFGKISDPVLEIKIKKGVVGDKWSYKLNEFTLDDNFTNQKIQQIFKESGLPLPILESIKKVFPTLLNSYKRRYYLSADNKFRITVDFDLEYRKINSKFNKFFIKPAFDENKIIELKYGLSDDNTAKTIATQFPFRLYKNSKYVNGINTIKQFAQ